MIRRIIKIDEEKCSGCGICAEACHEGAIEIINGKAKLTKENYCDGLGDCLPSCPANAISFEEREAPAYDEAAVAADKQRKTEGKGASPFMCPGMIPQQINGFDAVKPAASSQLAQWPCQIKLAPISAPYFNGVSLLIAADCTAYAYSNIHEDFMKGRVTLIGCPKLDSVDYSEKLTEIIRQNDIRSVTVLRMEVPCCGGIEMAVKKALQNSGKDISCQVVILSVKGEIL
ncbi:MAG: 4Fe-4S binding protein [Firmicutes bacterium]|nr:4Fe-4S binding protein [[Eubacterium] siraeum]MCM1487193.1 4Fe-4S binding protein [Bacillota bacterium]